MRFIALGLVVALLLAGCLQGTEQPSAPGTASILPTVKIKATSTPIPIFEPSVTIGASVEGNGANGSQGYGGPIAANASLLRITNTRIILSYANQTTFGVTIENPATESLAGGYAPVYFYLFKDGIYSGYFAALVGPQILPGAYEYSITSPNISAFTTYNVTFNNTLRR